MRHPCRASTRRTPISDLNGIAADLYGLAPEDFVPARTAAERQARAAGKRELAAQIHRLGKPTTVAWLANQLVRTHPEELGPLLELGAGLREATAALSGDELRRLSRQQHEVINALIGRARAIGRAAGHELTDATSRGLEETLRAALADADLADQLASGRLAGPLAHSGFGDVSVGDVSAAPPPAREPGAASGPRDSDLRRTAERQKAEAELAEARAVSDNAVKARDQARSQLAEAAAATTELGSKLQQLQAELDQTTRDHLAAERAERHARDALERADRLARQAAERLAGLVTGRASHTSRRADRR